METHCLLEKLKESIKRDFQVLEERCNEAQNKVHCLEKENIAAKELTNHLKKENACLKENLARLQKELAYKDEKLKRKREEQHRKDRWWNQYRRMSEQRFQAMKDHGRFPLHILENFVKRDIDKQMNDVPDNCSPSKEHELSKKNRSNLSSLKSKKKVRYERVSNAADNKTQNNLKDDIQVCKTSYTNEGRLVEGDENLLSDPNESTKLYQNFTEQQYNEKVSISDERAVCPKVLAADTEGAQCSPQPQGAKVTVSDKVSVCPKVCVPDTEDAHCSPQEQDVKNSVSDGMSVHPEILVPDTEDVYPEEADIGLHCSIGFPSAASTPLAAANSPLFGYDSDNDDDDGDDDISVGILQGATTKSPCNDAVNLLTAAKPQLSNLPKSDSQFPVDLSFTQPQSPTIPSRTRSLQQDLNLTADCSVSLLPHGMKNEENESKNDLKSGVDSIKDNNDTVFIRNKKDEQQIYSERDENHNYPMKKGSKQTTLDAKLLKVKESGEENDANTGKRKRESSDERDGFAWPSENDNEHEQRTETVFKVPVALPPKTPEVVTLEEFPPHVTGRKSYSTPLSSSGDMDQSADLFGNMDEQRSPDSRDEREKDSSMGNNENENVLNTNCTSKPGYKYVEVVRGKDERAKLNGYKCRDCQQYYQGLDLPEEELKKRLKHCSRHRARFSPPPSTPPGFWNLSFPDTQEYMDKGYLKTESQAPAPKRLRRTRRNKLAK